MEEALKILINEGVSEDIIYEFVKIVCEAWSGQVVSKQGYESPSKQEKYGYSDKRVEMSPDDYIKKCARIARRKGYHEKTKNTEKTMVNSRKEHTTDNGENTIEKYKKRLQDPKDKVNEPWIMYNPYGNTNNDAQDGLHRAIAAKELGMKKIPVHIYHNNSKRDTSSRREYKNYKYRNKKEAGDTRSYRREIENRRKSY